MVRALAFASPHHDNAEASWFMETTTKTFEELQDSGGERFVKLDVALAVGIMPTCPEMLQTRINQKDLELQRKDGGMLKGRQMVHMMYQWFEVKQGMGFYYGVNDITNLKYPGDAHIEHFMNTWYTIINGLQDALQPRQARDILRDKLKDSAMLAEDPVSYTHLTLPTKA